MSVKTCLQGAREIIAQGGRDLFDAVWRSGKNSEELNGAFDALEAQASPAYAALNRAIEAWAKSQDNADGRKAVELAKVPGATVTLEDWLTAPGRTRLQVMSVLNVAILKS